MTKLFFAAAAGSALPIAVVVTVVGVLNITGILGLPVSSVFVHVEGYLMVILLIVFS